MSNEMKPTIEEVKKVAIECGLDEENFHDWYYNLQEFAQYWMKEQQKIDEILAVRIKHPNPDLLSHAEMHIWDIAAIAALHAIRNNTGE